MKRKLLQNIAAPIETPKDNIATAIPGPAEISDSGDNPLRILKIRFAKEEISKEEYEEMRKMLES